MITRHQGLGRWMLGLLLVALVAVPATAQESLVFDGNILWGNVSGAYSADVGGANCPGGAYDTQTLGEVYFTRNAQVDPQLDPDFANVLDPRWDPQATSPALISNGAQTVKTAGIDPWFENTCYVGALDFTGGDPAADWTQEWTYFNYDGGLGRTDIDTGKPTVTVAANIAVNATWTSTSNYVLVGRIGVQAGATLTIEAGTVVLGSGIGSYLVVERDGDLVVNGTRQAPVVFTSSADFTQGLQFPGDWGGVVIHGKAVANCAAGGAIPGCNLTSTGNDCESEGGAGFFGGSDDGDSSGSIRYARVEYAGQEISPNNELNAWTFNAVGSGTIIEFLQAHQGTDDLFEWFGGTAHARHLVGTGGQDDGLDWQMGFRGRVQFAVIQQDDVLTGDKGIEADNNEFDFNCPGRSNPALANLTLVGNTGNAHGIHLRRGTAATIVNSIVTNFPGFGLRVQDEATFANCAGATPESFDCRLTGIDDLATVAGFRVAVSPNPSRGKSIFSFNLSRPTQVEVKIFDAQGRLVDVVHQGQLSEGPHALPWIPRSQAKGVYFYRIVAGGQEASGKMLVLN